MVNITDIVNMETYLEKSVKEYMSSLRDLNYYNIINEYDSNKWDHVDFYDNPDSVDLFLEILEYGYLDWRNVLPKDIVNI